MHISSVMMSSPPYPKHALPNDISMNEAKRQCVFQKYTNFAEKVRRDNWFNKVLNRRWTGRPIPILDSTISDFMIKFVIIL